MKVRWRQHEIIFASIAVVIAITGFWWKMMHLTTEQLDTYKNPFITNKASFNFYTNLILPQLGIFLVIYGAILWVNFLIVPRLVPYKNIINSSFKKYAWLFILIALLLFCMGSLLNMVSYYREEYNFQYPEFSFFPGNGHHAKTLMNLQEGYENAGAFLSGYGIYILIRELVIFFINRSGSRRAYRILICNQVTSFLLVLLIIPFFISTFALLGNSFFSDYYAIVLPVFLTYMINTYWLFPEKKEQSFFKPSFLRKLLIADFICSFPFAILSFGNDSYNAVSFIFLFWGIALFVLTPLNWLLFQQRRDKIIQLRGLEKELVKSTTNLQSLRSQINPHFLYNILNTLYGTALQENANRTANGIQQLGDMMRFMLDENHLDYIPMSREIEYLNNYIALQKLRLPRDAPIIIESNISDTNCNHKIAPMLLIPFVENAFKHGIRLNSASWIKISLHCDPKNVHFEVRNSMHAKADNDPEKERSGIGLVNVVERLKLIYPGKFQFSVNGDGTEYFVLLNIETTN